MTRRWAHALCAVAAVSLAACESDEVTNFGPAGQEAFQRYAAIGTSISQGVQSADNSVVYYNQVNAWPALLARQAGVPNFSLPLLRAPGCFPHFVAPLALGRNTRGQSIAVTDTTCAGLLPGITPPSATNIFNNLALSGARTSHALGLTPEVAAAGGLGAAASDVSAVFRRKMYPLVLPPGKSQVTAAMALDPTFVSVELGANDVLGTLGGIVAPGVSFVPFAAWQADYDKIVDSLETLGTDLKVLLATVPNVTNIVSLRLGSELHADSLEFRQRFRVSVASDCKDSQNRIFTPARVLGTIAFAAANPGVPVVPLSCANNPNATSPDYVLTPEDVQAVTAVVEQMNAHIASVAAAHGWALLDANALLGEIKTGQPAFSVARMMTCALPYGPFISLDGVHPSAAGQVRIANAAIAAINENYEFAIPTITGNPPSYAAVCP